MVEMHRRRFLTLLSGATAAIWLKETGVIAAPRRLVLELSGPCSFCGKAPHEVWSLAGIAKRSVRICDECIGLCCDILHEENFKDLAPNRPHRSPPMPAEPDALEKLLREHASATHDLLHRDDWLDLINKALAEERPSSSAGVAGRGEHERRKKRAEKLKLECSFCDASHRDVKKLIAGPRVYICDSCIADGASITGGLRW